jgi:hypothetical protein
VAEGHPRHPLADEAIIHCTRGAGIWEFASNDAPDAPDVVLASCGDIPTLETMAAVSLLREHLPELKVRVVNVVDLMRLQPDTVHPAGRPGHAHPVRFRRPGPRAVAADPRRDTRGRAQRRPGAPVRAGRPGRGTADLREILTRAAAGSPSSGFK